MRRLIKTGALLAMLVPLGACQIDELAGPGVPAASPNKQPSTDGKRPATVMEIGTPKDGVSRYSMAAE